MPGRPDGSAVRQYGIRASLLFEPNDKLDFILRLTTSLQNPIEYGVLGEPVGSLGIGNGVCEMFGASRFFRNGIVRPEVEADQLGSPRHLPKGATLSEPRHRKRERWAGPTS